MPPRSQLTKATPYAVEDALKRLGSNLRTARLRRNLSLAELAGKLGVDRHVLSDAENGKFGTSAGIYVGMLWAMNLLPSLDSVAPAAERAPSFDTSNVNSARASLFL